MKVLSIGSDRNIFIEGSDVRQRMAEYGKVFDELHIIVFATRRMNKELGIMRKKYKISDTVWVYPTFSRSKQFYLFDVYTIGKKIIHDSQFFVRDSVITAQDPFEAGLAGWLLKKTTGMPLQLQVHTDFLSPFFWRESLINKMRVCIAKFLLPRADAIRVVSKRIRDSVIDSLKISPAKIILLPIRVAQESYGSDKNYDIAGRNFILCAASRFSKEKNIELAIEAVADLKKENPDFPVSLEIHGEGRLKGKYESLIKQQRLEGSIFLIGAHDLRDVLFTSADIYLLTSNYEGYGRTVIQAMMAGCPVIMTDVGIAGDIVKNEQNGIVIPVGDKEALKKAILYLYRNREKRIEMGMRAKKDVAEHLYKDKEAYLARYKKSLEHCFLKDEKQTICYVLPFYDPTTDTHISYLYEFLERVGLFANIHLVVERSTASEIKIQNMRSIYVQKFQFLPFRIIENFIFLLKARLSGYKNFYIHYSYVSAWNASVVARIFGGTIFYWNCGMPWLYGKQYGLRTILNAVDYLVTGTNRIAELYSEKYGIPPWKIKIMPNWIDLKTPNARHITQYKEELKNTLHIPVDKKVVLFVHRLSKRKGAQYLSEIAEKLDGDSVLVAVGDGPEREKIKLLVARYRLHDRLLLIGKVPQREIGNYFLIADVFIMPSEEEGFPHVLLEAMAAGVPFVASGVGGVRDIVPESFFPYVVDGNSTDEFIRLIKDILAKSESEKGRMGNELRAWVTRYDMPYVMEIFLRLFI